MCTFALQNKNTDIMKNITDLKNFKVLVGTPHADIKNYCLEQYLATVKNLTYSNNKVLVVDNSETNKNKKKIVKNGISAIHIKRGSKSTRQLLAESHEHLRKSTLKGGYDFLLHLESDITPPPNIIEQLLSHQKSVVSGSYFINHGGESHLMVQEIEHQLTGIRETINMKGGSDIKYADGKLHKVYACGLGVTLIHKSVLEQIEFRYIEEVDAHPDTFFAHDLNQLGIEQFLDTSILCKHDNMEWDKIKNK